MAETVMERTSAADRHHCTTCYLLLEHIRQERLRAPYFSAAGADTDCSAGADVSRSMQSRRALWQAKPTDAMQAWALMIE